MTCILIVDDDSNNQRVLNYTLRKAAYETLTAPNGETALRLLNDSSVDLAIVDFAMPVMDGITLLKHIRAENKFEKLPVIILTGSGDDEERILAEGMGIQGFLNKPASSKMVLKIVNNILTQNAKD
jgi:DNA-binding response OmpR family regulator